jgi:hypothetical protein
LAQASGQRRFRTLSRWAAPALLAAVLGAGGCGLADYEGQMDVERQQVQRFDEETKYLAGPLEAPKLKSGGKEVDTPEVFFRPPHGIQSEADSSPGPPPYARYPARTSGMGTERVGVSEVYLALGGEKQKDFAATAVQALPQLSGVKSRSLVKQPPGRAPIAFNVYENPGTGFSLYICQRGDIQLAIGYQTDKSNNAAKAVDLSLESLEAGPLAIKLRRLYDERVRRHR